MTPRRPLASPARGHVECCWARAARVQPRSIADYYRRELQRRAPRISMLRGRRRGDKALEVSRGAASTNRRGAPWARGLSECAPTSRTASPRAASRRTALTAPYPCHRRRVSSTAGGEREKAADVELQMALPVRLALCISSVMHRRQKKRGEQWNRGCERTSGPMRSLVSASRVVPQCDVVFVGARPTRAAAASPSAVRSSSIECTPQ